MTLTEALTNGAQWGALLPLVTAVGINPAWSVRRKKLAAVAAALALGVLAVAVEGGWEQFQHGKITAATILAVVAASQTSYDLLWKPSRLAPWIEAVTSRAGPRRVA
jgi:hypothetical protein